MKAFKDTTGRTWDATVTTTGAERVKALAGVDLLDLGTMDRLVLRILNELHLAAKILYAVIKPQADKLRVTAEDFGETLYGDALHDALIALLEGIADFFPSPQVRANLQATIQATLRARERVADVASRMLAEHQPQMEEAEVAKATKRMEAAVTQALKSDGETSTEPPALSASTPAH